MTAVIVVDADDLHRKLDRILVQQAEILERLDAESARERTAQGKGMPLPEAARELGIHPKSALRMAKAKTFPAPVYQLGHRYYTNRAAIKRIKEGRAA